MPVPFFGEYAMRLFAVVLVTVFVTHGPRRGGIAADQDPSVDTRTGSGNVHFEKVLQHPSLLAHWSLRSPEHYRTVRTGHTKSNTQVAYDEELDAARVSLPDRTNELGQRNAPMLIWNLDQWEAGDRLVVQHEFLVSQAMHDLASQAGANGRSSRGFKFTNLCRDKRITYELRTFFTQDKHTLLDVRTYTSKLEGRTERDHLASDAQNPARTFAGKGGGYDRHPGPDSSWVYGKILPHPQTFKAINNRWVRVTYELTRVEDGTRVKVWLADEESGPALVIASPVDPELGFLTGNKSPITALYIELDTSQETTYKQDQPERWAALRNVVVLRDVNGEDLLGGRPLR